MSICERFVVLDGLHVDRTVLATLQAWAETRGISLQDAIQLAICFFNDRCRATDEALVLRPILPVDPRSGGRLDPQRGR